MRLPRPDDRRDAAVPIAVEDASRLAGDAVPLVEQALRADWYERPGNDADRAALTLCRLRRAAAGGRGGQEHGDAAVRAVLAQASPEAVVWLASRAVSYLDETGYPDAVAPWFPEEDAPE